MERFYVSSLLLYNSDRKNMALICSLFHFFCFLFVDCLISVLKANKYMLQYQYGFIITHHHWEEEKRSVPPRKGYYPNWDALLTENTFRLIIVQNDQKVSNMDLSIFHIYQDSIRHICLSIFPSLALRPLMVHINAHQVYMYKMHTYLSKVG